MLKLLSTPLNTGNNMEKITLVIRATINDDCYGSMDIDVKVCESAEAATASILEALNEEFETDCKSFADLCHKLNEDDEDFECGCKENDEACPFDFYWADNGKGEEFTIVDVECNGLYNRVITRI